MKKLLFAFCYVFLVGCVDGNTQQEMKEANEQLQEIIEPVLEPEPETEPEPVAQAPQQLPQAPANFHYHRDTLVQVMQEMWLDIPYPSVIPGLIEKETCITLKHSRCWSRFATLETSREYGFGLGQITVTSRFNVFEEVKQLEPRLRGWQWEDRFNARNQMIAIMAMVKRNFGIFRAAENQFEQFAMALAAYNGGIGGVQSDQRICRNNEGCNPNIWFGHVEHYSLKSKTKVQGYGQSFFDINRAYPKDILFERRLKYKPYIDKEFPNVVG
jgi:hypothetical protein